MRSDSICEASISGESFVTKPGPLVDILRRAISGATGIEPKLDTGGGTSDARFIANYCPVAEFGLVGATMHQTDECVPRRRTARSCARSIATSSRRSWHEPAAPRRASSVLVGMLRIARGRADGIACFGGSRPGVSVQPGAAAGVSVGRRRLGDVHRGAAARADRPGDDAVRAADAGGAVVRAGAHLEAARGAWMRFATAFNWCEWILPVAGRAWSMVPMSVAISAGVSEDCGQSGAADLPRLLRALDALVPGPQSAGAVGVRAMLFVVLVNLGTRRGRAGPATAGAPDPDELGRQRDHRASPLRCGWRVGRADGVVLVPGDRRDDRPQLLVDRVLPAVGDRAAC